jgi:hypothetical protein
MVLSLVKVTCDHMLRVRSAPSISGSVWFRAQFGVVPEDREALVLGTVTCDPGSGLHRQELGVKSRQFALEVIKSLSYFIMCQVLDLPLLN